MVITVWAVLVALLVGSHVLSKGFLALLAHEGHLRRLAQFVVLCLGVAFGAVKPPLAAWRANRDLSVEYVFAGKIVQCVGTSRTLDKAASSTSASVPHPMARGNQ